MHIQGQGPLLPLANVYVYINAYILREEIARIIVDSCVMSFSPPHLICVQTHAMKSFFQSPSVES